MRIPTPWLMPSASLVSHSCALNLVCHFGNLIGEMPISFRVFISWPWENFIQQSLRRKAILFRLQWTHFLSIPNVSFKKLLKFIKLKEQKFILWERLQRYTTSSQNQNRGNYFVSCPLFEFFGKVYFLVKHSILMYSKVLPLKWDHLKKKNALSVQPPNGYSDEEGREIPNSPSTFIVSI